MYARSARKQTHKAQKFSRRQYCVRRLVSQTDAQNANLWARNTPTCCPLGHRAQKMGRATSHLLPPSRVGTGRILRRVTACRRRTACSGTLAIDRQRTCESVVLDVKVADKHPASPCLPHKLCAGRWANRCKGLRTRTRRQSHSHADHLQTQTRMRCL